MNASLRKTTALVMGGWIFLLAAGVHLVHTHGPVCEDGCCHACVEYAGDNSPVKDSTGALQAAGDAGHDETLGTICSACAFLNQYKVPRRDLSPSIVFAAVVSLYLPEARYCCSGNGATIPLVPRAPPAV